MKKRKDGVAQPSALSPPTTLWEYFRFCLKDFIRHWPARLITIAVVMLATTALHTYLLAYINDGFYYDSGRAVWTKYVVNYDLRGSPGIAPITRIAAILIWPLAVSVITGLFWQLKTQKPKLFFMLRLQYILQTVQCVVRGKKGYLTRFLVGLVAALGFAVLVLNPFFCILLAVALFLSISAEQASPMFFWFFLFHGSLSRLFKRENANPFQYRNFSILFTGAVIGLLLNGVLQLSSAWDYLPYVTLLVFSALLVLYRLGILSRKAAGKASMFAFFFVGAATWMALRARAHDGGFRENGSKNMIDYIGSPGSDQAIGAGAGPAAAAGAAAAAGGGGDNRNLFDKIKDWGVNQVQNVQDFIRGDGVQDNIGYIQDAVRMTGEQIGDIKDRVDNWGADQIQNLRDYTVQTGENIQSGVDNYLKNEVRNVSKPPEITSGTDAPNSPYGQMNSVSLGSWGYEADVPLGNSGVEYVAGFRADAPTLSYGAHYTNPSLTGSQLNTSTPGSAASISTSNSLMPGSTLGGSVNSGSINSMSGIQIGGTPAQGGVRISTTTSVQGPAANLNQNQHLSTDHVGAGASVGLSVTGGSQIYAIESGNMQASVSAGVNLGIGAGGGVDISSSGVQADLPLGPFGANVSIGTTDGSSFVESVMNLFKKDK